MVSLRRTVQYAILTLPTGYCVEKVIGHEMLGEGRAQLLPVAVLIAAYLFDRIAEPRWPGYRVRLAESARAKWVGWVPSLALGVVLAEPTAVLVAYGAWLHPIGFAGLVVLIALALVFQWRNRSIWPERARIDPVAVALMLGYAGIASYGYVAYGASESDCRRIEASEYMRPILARAQFVERGEEWACTPDAIGIDAAADRLIFTLKRWNRGPGRGNTATDIPSDAVGSLSLSDPLFRADRLIRVGDEEEGASPGRIAVNPDRSEVYVIVHGDEGHHGVWIFNYANGLNVRRVVPLPFEPTDVRFDDQRLIIAAREGAVATFALDSGRWLKFRNLGEIGDPGYLSRLEPHPEKPVFFASVFSRRFLTLDERSFNTIRVAKVGVPTEGLAYDEWRNRIYAAAPLTREVLVLDGDNVRVLARIDTGAVVRDLVIDEGRRIAVATAWAEGRLIFIDLDANRVVARLKVGRPALDLNFDGRSGRLFATSSCGLFEILVDDLLESRGLVKRSRAMNSVAAPTS